ncbi:MAG: protein-L-isoaspartate O-methyltransferase family protein, partial [Aestuariivirgaceae bacterium]
IRNQRMVDYKVARENMIESQIRPNGITDSRVIDAIAAVPRELFVSPDKKSIAYMDEDIMLDGLGSSAPRHLMEPMAFARLVQLAEIGPDDFVLDVGAGSGYSIAVVAHLAQSAVAIEEDAALAEHASATLDQLEISNAAVLNAPHGQGCPDEAPFDAIIINGRVPLVPQNLLDQLKEGGRLAAVVGDDPLAQAQLWTRHGDTFAKLVSFDATISPLPGIEAERPGFTF